MSTQELSKPANWNTQRRLTVRRLWLAGFSARDIADELFRADEAAIFSSDAIHGLIRRNGWDTLLREKKRVEKKQLHRLAVLSGAEIDVPERDTSQDIAKACDAHLDDLRACYAEPVPAITSERPVMVRMAPMHVSMIGSPGAMCADEMRTGSPGLRAKSGARQ